MLKSSNKIKKSFNTFYCLYIPILILLTLIFLISWKTGIPVQVFTQDPAVVAGKAGLTSSMEFAINPFLGIISYLGILLWCVATSVCYFTSLLITEKGNQRKSERAFFLRFFGSITLILLLDDLFLFHESLAPNLFIPEKLVYICYASMVLFGFVRFRKAILKTKWIVLFLAVVFFFLSIVVDTFGIGPDRADLYFILEDGFKLLGITSWSLYFSIASFQFIRSIKT